MGNRRDFIHLGFIAFLISSYTTVVLSECPPKTYKSSCRNCTCEWSNTLDCDRDNGMCQCMDGFHGRKCEKDVNECFFSQGICGENKICINTLGSYECLDCPIGFTLTKFGACEPCMNLKFGLNCSEKCKCVPRNTLYCDSSSGECICLKGWEGVDCSQSVDDCKKNNCPGGTCEDRHRSYVCNCGTNRMAVQNRCERYVIDFISLNTAPALGDWVDIYIFIALPALYFTAPHILPDIKFRITDDQSPDICWVSYFNQAKNLKGSESILYDIKMPGSRYHAYIHIKKRFMKAILTTVTAESSLLLRKWHLAFSVRYKSKQVEYCLQNLSIPKTENVNVTKAGRYRYDRRKFLMFEIDIPSSSSCYESPRVIWDYFQIKTGNDKSICLLADQIVKLDIDAITRQSRQMLLSDHHQRKEIISKRTLPFGVLMLCVTAYIQRSISTKVVACGFITIIPSWTITGKLWPSSSVITAPYSEVVASSIAYLREPDFGSKLSAKWVCIEPTKECKYLKDFALGLQLYVQPFTMNRLTNYTFQVQVSVAGERQVSLKRNLMIVVGNYSTTLLTEIFCIKSCTSTIKGGARLVLRVKSKHAKTFKWTITYRELSSDFGDVTIKGAIFDTLFRLKKGKDYDFYSKPGVFELGHKFKIECHTSDGKKKTGWARYEFSTVRLPSGKGCTISPDRGKAVFTKFNIECKDYIDEDSGLPLLYKLYQEGIDKTTHHQILELVGYSNDGQFPNVTLSSESSHSKVHLQVKISTVLQMSISVKLQVLLYTDDQDDILKKSVSEIKTLGVVGSQDEIRLIKDVATIMRASSTASLGRKKKVRKQLLSNMKRFEAVAGDSIEHSSTALTELTARDDEVDEDGLTDGLASAERITRYLGRCGGGDMDTIKQVAGVQVSAMNSLVKVSSVYGQEKHKKTMSAAEKNYVVNSGREQARKTISAVTQILTTLRGAFDQSDEPIKIKRDTLEVVLESKNIKNQTSVEMKSDNENVSFSISTRSLNFLGNGSIETEFEVYHKTPFSFASDLVQGDIPVIKVKFVEPDLDKGSDATKGKAWQFSKPADIFLKNRNINAEGTDYSVLVLVNKYSSEVHMSSCIYLSVKASTVEVTVLEVISPDNLIIKAKARYTNSISAFELLTDYDMIDIPLYTPGDEFKLTVEGKNLTRRRNFIFLPRLTKKQIDQGIPYYNVKLSVKKGHKFENTEDNDNSTITVEKLMENNNLSVNVDALDLYNVTVSVIPQKLSCVHFDEKKMNYSYDSCELSVFTGKEELHCRCVVAAAFSASYFIMPRLINPLDIHLFSEIFKNPLIVSMVICLWLSFIALFVWGRRKDKEDDMKTGATVLDDNKENELYVYLICVVTGNSAVAGTTSNVYLHLKGTWGNSKIHALKDNSKALFKNGAENWFVLTTESDLGYLQSALIWTDHSGGNPSWFLYKIYVQNVQTGEAWSLMFNSWLSTTKGTGQIIAEIPAVEESTQKRSWLNKITGKTAVDLRNEHLWFGMIYKTAHNKFTRFRRLATAMSMLQALMIVNLTFYEIKDEDDSRQFRDVFGVRLHITSINIGIQSCLIMSLFGIGLSFTFNRISPKKRDAIQEDSKARAIDEAFQKKKAAITLGAVKAYLGNDIDNEKAVYILKKFREAPNEEEVEKPEADEAKDNLWFTLPWWFIYMYWGFVIIFNIFVAYYIMLYGLELGYEKSVNWVLSFFAGFAFNVFIVQPFKVVGMVIFLVIVFKQTYSLKDTAPLSNLVDASKAIRIKMIKARTYAVTSKINQHTRPPNRIQMAEIIKRLAIEANTREMVRDLFLYTLFLTSVIAMIYQHSFITRSYLQTTAMNKMLFMSNIEDGEETSLLDEISTVDDIWEFFSKDLLTFLIQESEDKLDVNSFYFVGTARIRQVRVERDESNCDNIPSKIVEIYNRERCSFSMYEGKEEKNNFNQSWLNPMENKDAEKDEEDEEEEIDQSIYKYMSAKELNTSPISAPRYTYPGGGYVLTLQRFNMAEAIGTFRKLSESSWIDHLTRCIFVEFTIYNPDANLYTYVVIGFEFDIHGGPYPFKMVTSSRLYHYEQKVKLWTQIAEVTVAVCSAFYTVIVMKNVLRLGIKAFVFSVWNLVDVLILTLIYGLAFVIYWRDAAMVSVLSVFAQYGNNRFLDFQAVFYKDYAVCLVEGLLGGVAFLKLIYVLRFNPFSKIFMKSVDIAKSDILGYTTMVIVYLVGFSLAGRIIFGRFLYSYAEVERCLLSLLFFTLGEAYFPTLVSANKIMGPIYFLMVLFVTQYIMINFFIAMVRDGLDMARTMEAGKEDATIRYMVDTIKLYLGIGANRQGSRDDPYALNQRKNK